MFMNMMMSNPTFALFASILKAMIICKNRYLTYILKKNMFGVLKKKTRAVNSGSNESLTLERESNGMLLIIGDSNIFAQAYFLENL